MRRTFSRFRYSLLAIAVSLVMFLAIAWASPLALLIRAVSETSIPLSKAFDLGTTLLLSSLFNFEAPALLYTGVVALLIGVNAALLSFYIRMFRTVPSHATGGFIGGAAALLGFGCAACGSVFIFSLLGASGGTLAALLPFGGAEIGYIGIALLCASAFFLARAVNKPAVCPI